MNTEEEADLQFVTVSDLARRIGMHRNTMLDWIERGILPEPTRITTKCVGWPRAKIEAHVVRLISGNSRDLAPDESQLSKIRF